MFELDQSSAAADFAYPRVLAANLGMCEQAVLPREIDLVSPARAQAANLTGWPCRRESREQMDFACVTLNQHLGDAGGCAEIAVDLEGRMSIE